MAFRMRSKCILGVDLQMQVTTDWQEVLPSLMELTGLPFKPLSHVPSSPSSSPLTGSDSRDFILTISVYTLLQLTQSFFSNNISLTVFQITNF